jgi:hypothetical protein
MIIENKTNGIIGVHSSEKNAVATLMPGGNQMSEEIFKYVKTELEFLENSKKVVIWKTKAEYDARGKAKEVKLARNLADLEANEAEKLVAETVDNETLLAWKKAETRDSVRLAIQTQIDKITNYNSGS